MDNTTQMDLFYKQRQQEFSFSFCGWICVLFLVLTSVANAQVTASIDSTKIRIGEQITYSIKVATDTTKLVIFPEGQTFQPLELLDSYTPDTTRNNQQLTLVKSYALTQFDSGHYTIPRQKVIVGSREFFTDSLRVEVNNVQVDTTKQGLYDIKPMIEVQKAKSHWLLRALWILGILALIAFVLYWFIWRKKPLTEEEKIALLPPYERAKMALKKLDESDYLNHSEIKDYYSELTLIIRRYLDEQVYDRALESTTAELIQRLNLLREGNKIELSQSNINNIETILQRADLVKFAKSAPDIELARIDRETIDHEIDHVKDSLPEPTEEEKLLDEEYKEAQAKKQRKRKIVLTTVGAVGLLLLVYIGFSLRYGFNYVNDTLTANKSLALWEGEWVESAYGYPPIHISTPVVLERIPVKEIDTISNVQSTAFSYGNLLGPLNIMVTTSKLAMPDTTSIDLGMAVERNLQMLEKNDVRDILTKKEKFVTPNAAEGVKIYGTASFPTSTQGQYRTGKYSFLAFTTGEILQQIMLVWDPKDRYADDIMERVLNSIELKKLDDAAGN